MSKIKLKLSFNRNSVDKPVIYHLIKKYDILCNILHADINYGSKGTLIAEWEGTDENLQQGLQYLKELGISYESYDKSILRDEDACIDCGACTAVCPTQALRMNREGYLEFKKEKCVVCELCIPTCPLRIIRIEL